MGPNKESPLRALLRGYLVGPIQGPIKVLIEGAFGRDQAPPVAQGGSKMAPVCPQAGQCHGASSGPKMAPGLFHDGSSMDQGGSKMAQFESKMAPGGLILAPNFWWGVHAPTAFRIHLSPLFQDGSKMAQFGSKIALRWLQTSVSESELQWCSFSESELRFQNLSFGFNCLPIA